MGRGFVDYRPVGVASGELEVHIEEISSFYGGYNISCHGNTNGYINIAVSGGTSPYTYLWNTGATTQNITTLSAGTYSVAVTDSIGSTISLTTTLTEPDILTVSTTTSDYNGYGTSSVLLSDGWITITPAGGVAPYTYLWSNGETTATINNKPGGFYNYTVTDANGCTKTQYVILTYPSYMTLTENFRGGGFIAYTILGGVYPYYMSSVDGLHIVKAPLPPANNYIWVGTMVTGNSYSFTIMDTNRYVYGPGFGSEITRNITF